MLRSISFLCLGLLLIPTVAAAEPCAEGGLQGKFLTRCHQRLRTCERYRGSGKDRCIQRAVKNSLGAQQREGKRMGAQQALDAKWGVCASESYAKACYAMRALRNNVCGTAHNQPRFSVATNAPLAESVGRLTKRYRAYAEGMKNMATFVANYGKCDQAPPRHRPNCTFPESQQQICSSAKGKFKANWAAYIDSFAKNDLPGMLKEIEKLERRRGAPTTMQNYHVDAPMLIVEEMLRVNRAFPWIAVPERKLIAIQKRVQANHKKMRKTIERMIANVNCPVSGRSGKYFEITKRHLAATKNAGSTMKETIKRLGITGSAATSYNPFLRMTYQSLPGKMCVRQVRNGVEACRVFRMTFRRSKPNGGGWSPWRFYSIGGGGLMLCKKLR